MTLQKLYNAKVIEDGMRLIEHCLDGTKACNAAHLGVTDILVQIFAKFSRGIGYC
jgi:hypothetical protein